MITWNKRAVNVPCKIDRIPVVTIGHAGWRRLQVISPALDRAVEKSPARYAGSPRASAAAPTRGRIRLVERIPTWLHDHGASGANDDPKITSMVA
jgi:hypothetical protein